MFACVLVSVVRPPFYFYIGPYTVSHTQAFDIRGQGVGLALWAITTLFKSARGEMMLMLLAPHLARRVCRMSATELVCAAPSQQRLRRSSITAALRTMSGRRGIGQPLENH